MSLGQIQAPVFAGSIPEIYDQYLVPLIFEPYAIDLAQRLVSLPLTNVLELACGTGAVTRRLALSLPHSVFIVATDLSQPMLERAGSIGTSRAVEWRQADAMHLPFDKASFDAVVCQFGVMFFPDRARAFEGGLLDLRTRQGLYAENPKGVEINGGVLYRATITIPSQVPVGTYTAETFLVDDHRVVAAATRDIDIGKSGFERFVALAARKHSALYGLFAVLLSLGLGWSAAAAFRRRF